MTLAIEQEAEAGFFPNSPFLSSVAVKRVAEQAQLADINEAMTSLVIWERALPPNLFHWIDALSPETLPHFRILVSISDLRAALGNKLDAAGLTACEMCAALIDDIAALAVTYASITCNQMVDLRLERIDHDACWKFHRDMVEARLLTTYRGASTQWVRPAHAEQALEEQTDYDGPLETLNNQDVAIFKGAATRPNQGIVHRSPPIEGSGETRLLLCLNEPSLASPAYWKSEGISEAFCP